MPTKIQGSDKVSRPAPAARTLAWAPAVLSFAILVLGLYSAFFTARLVYRTYSPVLYFDQWAIVDSMMRMGKTPVSSLLWAQHNEHRIPVGRITGYADLEWFGGRNISLLIEIYLMQVSVALLFIWMFRRFGPARRDTFLTAVGFLVFCMLCPLQLGNFIWGFQTAFVFTGLAAAAAFAATVCHSVKLADGRQPWISAALVFSWAAAFMAAWGRADGLFVWPILVLLGFALRFPKKTQIVTALLGAIGFAIYLAGYQTPVQHAKPWESIQHPIEIAKFVVTYFASTWDASPAAASSWPTAAESMTILGLAGVLFSAAWFFYLRPSARGPLQAFLITNLLFTMLAAFLTSLGRMNFGTGQAMSGHYQAIALSFWASLAALILASLPDPAREINLVQAQIALLILMLATAGRYSALEQASKQHQMDLARAYQALAFNPADLDAIKILYPDVQGLRVWYAYLRSHNLGPDPHEFVVEPLHPLQVLAAPIPNWGGYKMAPSNKCLGYLDAVRPIAPGSETVVAGGWAWDVDSAKPPVKILLSLPDGLVVGIGPVDAARPDVRSVRKEVTDSNSGWNVEAIAPHGSMLRAFALLSDAKSICPVPNEIAVP